MKKEAAIAGVICYFIISWILKGVLFSIALKGNSSLGSFTPFEIEFYSASISAIICGLIAQLVRFDFNTNRVDGTPIGFGIILLAITYGLLKLPVSMELTVLFNITNIVFIVYFAVFYEE